MMQAKEPVSIILIDKEPDKGKQHFVKLPNGDEFYPITISYISKEIKGGILQVDG